MRNLLLLFALLFINISFAQVTGSFTTQQSDFTFTYDGTYDIIKGENNIFTEQIGAPQLPIFKQKYLLPAGSIFTNITVSTPIKEQLTESYYIYPTQPLVL